MGKILGLDLGTNSIGWAIRINDGFEREIYFEKFFTDRFENLKQIQNKKELNKDNEIVDNGVVS